VSASLRDAQPGETVATAVLRLVAAHGTGTVFGLPGVHNLAFWRAFGRAGGVDDSALPRLVGVRHEQTTVFAADGLARATGRPGVALTTTGPGAANAVAAFGEAAASHSPVVLVASQVATRWRAGRPGGHPRGVLHDSRDQGALFEPLARAVLRPVDPEGAVAAVAQALRIALTPPRGPVYVGVPTDVLEAASHPAAPSLLECAAAAAPAPDARQVAAAVALLAGAAGAVRALIWAGGGALHAGEPLAGLAARLSAPVVTTFAAAGLLAGSPWLVGAPPHEPEVAALIGGADVLVVVGSELDGMTTRNWAMPRPPRLVVVDVDPDAVAGRTGWRLDAAVRADAAAGVTALLEAMGPDRADAAHAPPGAEARRVSANVRARLERDPASRPALALVRAVETWPGPLVCDMAVAGYWVGGYARRPGTRLMQYPVGWGTLGYALPAAVGAACAARGPVLAVCGDGGLAMGVGELATLVQERLPVTVLVVEDGGYGMLRYDQDRAGDAHRGVRLHGPDLLALAAAYGLPGARTTVDGLAGVLAEAAKRDDGPFLVHLPARFVPPRTTSPRWHDPL
jgi:thiamine pyrophosphate-dependent acetolactate synthase large subunit-like protein